MSSNWLVSSPLTPCWTNLLSATPWRSLSSPAPAFHGSWVDSDAETWTDTSEGPPQQLQDLGQVATCGHDMWSCVPISGGCQDMSTKNKIFCGPTVVPIAIANMKIKSVQVQSVSFMLHLFPPRCASWMGAVKVITDPSVKLVHQVFWRIKEKPWCTDQSQVASSLWAPHRCTCHRSPPHAQDEPCGHEFDACRLARPTAWTLPVKKGPTASSETRWTSSQRGGRKKKKTIGGPMERSRFQAFGPCRWPQPRERSYDSALPDSTGWPLPCREDSLGRGCYGMLWGQEGLEIHSGANLSQLQSFCCWRNLSCICTMSAPSWHECLTSMMAIAPDSGSRICPWHMFTQAGALAWSETASHMTAPHLGRNRSAPTELKMG